uniref:Putative ovule protein n=1 Tax=Solanum chacoense TaxID=4108 RepID=A0A0V0GXY0_SOLCH
MDHEKLRIRRCEHSVSIFSCSSCPTKLRTKESCQHSMKVSKTVKLIEFYLDCRFLVKIVVDQGITCPTLLLPFLFVISMYHHTPFLSHQSLFDLVWLNHSM